MVLSLRRLTQLSPVDLDARQVTAGAGVTLAEVHNAVARSNFAAGGGVIQKNNAEYLVRFVGWLKNKQSIEDTVIRRGKAGTPLRVGDDRRCRVGPSPSRAHPGKGRLQ